MKKNLLTFFCVSAVLFFIPASVQAEILLNEHFNQSSETLATNDNSFANEIASTGWTNINGSGQIYMSSTDLTYSGYKSETDATGSAEYKTTFGKKVAAPLKSSVNSGSVYAAAIFKFSACSPASSPGRDYLWAFTPATSSISTAGNHFGRLCAQKSATTFQLGIAKNVESAVFISYTDELSYNTPYLIVMEYEFVAGGKNDIVRLYVNPSKGDKPAATIECKQYAENTSGTDVGSGTKDDPSQFAAFMLYSTSTTRLACLIDELKVTTSWDDLWEEGDAPDPTPVVDVPEPAASNVTLSSATISWNEVDDADSYILQWKVSGGSYSDDIEIDKDIRSYDLTDLESETKYYVKVKTIAGENQSDWAEINFTTLPEPASIDYKDITFNRYSTTDAMPKEGTYYLAKNIVEYNDITLTGDLTLNLHGKQIFMYGTHIIVPNGISLTICDDAEDGKITGGYAGSFTDRGLITVKEGGSLIISEGGVVNIDDESEQVAIDNHGTLKISGAPTIVGNKTDIHLNSSAYTITIEADKPLTNSTPYKVYKLAGSSFTSGWANMGDEKPSDYFVSSNTSARGVCLNASGEAQIVVRLNLSESSENNSINTYEDQLVNVSLDRIFTSASYNTLCLPFALTDAQLQTVFGSGYDLQEFTGSSVNGEELDLSFNKVTSLTAGKPYLIQPSEDVSAPTFTGVTISVTSPVDQTGDIYVSFHGVFAPTELEADNRNLLFLGADNTLFWPNETAPINGFRAYFEIKGSAAQAAKRARIVNRTDEPTAIDQTAATAQPAKRLVNGQLLIDFNGKTYNAQGILIK